MASRYEWLQRFLGTAARATGWLSLYVLLLDALGIHWWSTRPGARLFGVIGIACVYGLLDAFSRQAEHWWRHRNGGATS